MPDYMADLTNRVRADQVSRAATREPNRSPKASLDMTDFLNLMVAELTNQSMDATADTSDMLNQLVQMQMIQAITNMTDASVMSYAASLVGKEVTVAEINSDGTIKEVVGTVTGTGTMNGEQVIFVGEKFYHLSEIMAVGRLPKVPKPEGKPEAGETPKPEGENKPGETEKPEGTKPEGTDKPVEKPVQPEQNGGAQKPEQGGAETDKAPTDADKPAAYIAPDRSQQSTQQPLVPGVQADQNAGNA